MRESRLLRAAYNSLDRSPNWSGCSHQTRCGPDISGLREFAPPRQLRRRQTRQTR